MALEVIRHGFGRTGTDSMREALNMLGFGPCHHMFEVTDNPLMKARWRSFMDYGVPDWPSLFAGYRSCVDWPSAHYWRELVPLYPKARVILTWRDPESWWTSFEATILRYLQTAEDRQSVGVRNHREGLWRRAADRTRMIRAYEDNVAAVIAAVPKDRLMIHNLGDGWEPLCAHLGVPFRNNPIRQVTRPPSCRGGASASQAEGDA